MRVTDCWPRSPTESPQAIHWHMYMCSMFGYSMFLPRTWSNNEENEVPAGNNEETACNQTGRERDWIENRENPDRFCSQHGDKSMANRDRKPSTETSVSICYCVKCTAWTQLTYSPELAKCPSCLSALFLPGPLSSTTASSFPRFLSCDSCNHGCCCAWAHSPSEWNFR